MCVYRMLHSGVNPKCAASSGKYCLTLVRKFADTSRYSDSFPKEGEVCRVPFFVPWPLQ